MEAGLPGGAVNVYSLPDPVAQRLVAGSRVSDLISFTGSATVGWMLKGKSGRKKSAGTREERRRYRGGPGRGFDWAARRCVSGRVCLCRTETCISVQRILVHESIADTFTKKLLALAATVKAGDPAQDATVVGPLIDPSATRRVESWIQEAVAQGARVLAGGARKESILEATVMSQVTPSMKVSCEEVFGPLVTVTAYRQFEQAVAMLNNSPYGLQAGIFSQNVNRIFSAFRDLEVGAVLANEIPAFRAEHMPYGGVKDSGLGREGVRYAIEEMTEPRLLVLNLRCPPTASS